MVNVSGEYVIGEYLRQTRLTLALAESCTGGLISQRVTNIPGSSEYYLGGVVAYSNQVKVKVLGVTQATLDRYGAVSEQTVLEMARGVRTALLADVGVSVSGVAGPGGGTPEKPVGTVWICTSSLLKEQAYCCQFFGDRIQIKDQAADMAFMLLIDHLKLHSN